MLKVYQSWQVPVSCVHERQTCEDHQFPGLHDGRPSAAVLAPAWDTVGSRERFVERWVDRVRHRSERPTQSSYTAGPTLPHAHRCREVTPGISATTSSGIPSLTPLSLTFGWDHGTVSMLEREGKVKSKWAFSATPLSSHRSVSWAVGNGWSAALESARSLRLQRTRAPARGFRRAKATWQRCDVSSQPVHV